MKETEDKMNLIPVYSTNNYALFQMAKSILSNYKIKFYTTGEYLSPMEPAVYSAVIKVFEKDEKKARELLKELVQTDHIPSAEFDRKMYSSGGYWVIGIIIVFILIMIFIFSTIN